MKKLLKIMFGAVAAASVMCGLAACDGGDGECEHVWNEGETTVAATCTEDGVLTYTCTLCDEERTEPIARLGHDFTGEWQKDAQGHWHKCSRCEAADDVVAHTMEDGEVITPATEEEEGTQKIVCSVCGYESIKTLPVLVGHSAASEWSSDDTYHWHVCTAHGDCGMQLDKSEHDWTETDRVEATETANGKVTYECSVCKAAKEEILYYDGHVAATEWSSDKTHHWHKCTAHENCAEQMDKAEHDWDDGEVTKAATCAQKGEKTFTCETCGATKTEEIPQLAHDFSEEWSSDAEGHWHKCKNCDATDTKAAHEMQYINAPESNKHSSECKVCGYEGELTDHVWGEGEVTKPATLYAKGERTFTCACGATRKETIAARADFASDFTVENQDGAWSYGKAEVTAWEADKFAFTFTAATDKNADSWLIDGLEIKSGWVNADGTLAIGYEVEKDIIAQIRAEFKGTNATSRTSLRLAVMRGGALAGTAQFAADENSNAVLLERTVSLKAGDVLYIIINKEGADGMGALNVTLAPATEEQSKHTASQEWSHDESSHWKTCASHLYCTEQLDKAAHKTVLNKVDDANHSADCECGYKAVAPHAWDEGKVTTAATCTQDGVKTFTCECGATKTEKIDRLGHDFAEEWAGDEDYHWHKCSRCDATNDKAEHQWTETGRTEATETENGKVTYECSVCKATKEEVLYYDPHVAAEEWSHDENYHWHACTAHENCTEQMDKAEHEWSEGVVTKAATCTQKGERTFTCACGATKTEEIAQLDHDFTGDWLSDADGHWHKCKNCDATDEKVAHEMQYIDAPESNKHIGECKVCGYKGSPADHVWGEGEVTTPATLYAEGERTFTCECGATRTETIAAGADFAADFTVENQDGAWSYGKAEVTAWEADKFAFTFTAATDKNADSWLIDGLEIKSGWVNADGTLAIGYEVEKDIIAQIRAEFKGTNATSRTSLRLAVMRGGALAGTAQFAADENSNAVSLERTVSLKAGDVLYIIINKEGTDGMGALNVTLTPATEEQSKHTASQEWSHDESSHWKTCASHLYCTEQLDKAAHKTVLNKVDDANHSADCECGYKAVAPHDWNDGVVTEEATCTQDGVKTFTCECGATKTEKIDRLGHDFAEEWAGDEDYHWHKCSRCDATNDKAEHQWTETDRTPATETENGKVTYECSVCKATKEEVLYYDPHVAAKEWSHDENYHWHACTAHENCAEQMDKAEHDWDDGVVTEEATCTQKGERTFTCTCGATKTEEIAQLDHDFTGDWLSDADGHWHKCKNCDATDEKVAHEMQYIDAPESNKHSSECKVCGYKGSPADHVWGEGEVTTPATLYAEGERTFTCECGATRTETIAAGADFAADFTLENQDGAWSYGKANITNWSDYQFALEFIAATDKNADSWLIGGLAIKSGWVNADGTLAIGYKVASDITANISVNFTGNDANSRVSLRLIVKGADGRLRIPVQFNMTDNTASLNNTVSLKAGDEVYVIANKENAEGITTNGMGSLKITLTPAQTVADFGADFSLENQGGDWSYGKADYKWSSEDNPGEDFTFVKAEGKNEGGDGWVSGGVEIKKDFISFGDMAAVGYTNNTQGELTFKAVITVCGGTADTRADLRIGVKNAEGTLKNGPSFHNNTAGNILYVTVDITLAAGDTVYFLFSNSAGGNEGAWPNGNLYISLVGAQA